MNVITLLLHRIHAITRHTWLFLLSFHKVKDFPYLASMSVAAGVTGLVFALAVRAFTGESVVGIVTNSDIFIGILVILSSIVPIYLTRDDVARAMQARKEETILSKLRTLAPWRGEANIATFTEYAKKHTGIDVSLHSVLTVARQELLPIDRQFVTVSLLALPTCMRDYLDNVFVRSNVADTLNMSISGKQLQRLLADSLATSTDAHDFVAIVKAWQLRSAKPGLQLVVDNSTVESAR